MNIKTVVAKDAADFVNHIRLSHEIWQMGNADPNRQSREIWGFRGQQNTEWGLIPSAFRESGTTLGYKPDSGPPPLKKNKAAQKRLERFAVMDFVFFTDRIGLPVPGDGQHFRLPRRLIRASENHEDTWPLDFELETLALAQHHGVPTRLLDFSHNPIVAAYFACYGAWAEMGKPSIHTSHSNPRKLAVWAVHLPLIFSAARKAWRRDDRPRIIMVTVPRAVNTFLHQQDGFFLVDLEADSKNYPPLEEAIEAIYLDLPESEKNNFSSDVVIKLELEWTYVPEVLNILWNEFFHGARLQPTYDKSVEALEDYRALNWCPTEEG